MMASIVEYEKYQSENAGNVIRTNIFDETKIRYIGGLDISFDKINPNNACSYLTIYDLTTNTIVHESYNLCKMFIPYVSGCLGIREVPEYVKLLNAIKYELFYPDVLMIDGFGVLHPREFGSASHVGYLLNIPTIGVAKTLMCIDGLDEHNIKTEFKTRCRLKGEYINLVGNSGKIYGSALKSADNTSNPIYVSIGYGCDLETATKIVNKISFYKIPEPIRNSDIKSKLYF
jgi:deoxyinosine 3'endonuclease (endonuclease V)